MKFSQNPLSSAPRTLVFLDAQVQEYATLANHVLPGVEIVLLDAAVDGVEQITQALAQRQGIADIHVVSHGRPGGLQLGSGWLSQENLEQYAAQIQTWGQAARLFLYGCNVAANAIGQAFVEYLAQLSQTVIAASSTLTGSAALGGDWNLDRRTAAIASVPEIFQATALESYAHVLANIRIDSVDLDEGLSGSQTIIFDVTLDAAGSAATVDYVISDNTATLADNDYSAASLTGTVSFSAVETKKTITVQINGDNRFEADETFYVTLSNPSAGHTITKARGVGIILNDDTAPIFSVSDATPVMEGASGAVTATTFTISRTGDTTQASSISYVTAGNTATSGDFTATAGTLSFAAGDTSKTITVNVLGDDQVETNETFFVNLLSPVNATIADGQGIGMINNDDVPPPPPSFAIANETIAEGNVGNSLMTFTVTRSGDTSQADSVDYITADNTATVAANDYEATSGTLNFGVGVTTQTFTVNVTGNTIFSGDRSFFVNLTNPSLGTSITVPQGTGTITEDDPVPALPTLAINSVSVTEGAAGTNRTATFTVTRSGNSTPAVSVQYATADDTATAPGDYTTTSGTLNFAAGQTSQAFTVTVNGDDAVEANESFFVNLTNATGATITTAQGTGTITNDDTAPGSNPSISIDDVTISEGNAVITLANFAVSLSAVSAQTVTVAYTTADGTATVADKDYNSATGTLSFAPGETTKTIPVQIRGNLTTEPDETFTIALSNPVNGTIADSQATATITNDDLPPTISVNDVTVTEGDTGTTNAAFVISLSGASTQPISVQYQTADGTARVADGDYTAIPATFISFNPGETSKTVNVAVKGDSQFEPNETFSLRLLQSINATATKTTGTATISNNDKQPTGGNPTETPNNPTTPSIQGTPNNDNLNGTNRSDNIAGSDGDDDIKGNDGDDVLLGGNGNDKLSGGDGNDILYGRDGKDQLTGDAGDDILIGGFRNDVLTGGAGRDRFEFRRQQQGIDRITDFSPADDTIVLHKQDFKRGLKAGILPTEQLQLGAKALDQSDRFIYNQTTGEFFFDVDGVGGSKQILLARLGKGVNLTQQDFLVI